jgi:hypothetical protein
MGIFISNMKSIIVYVAALTIIATTLGYFVGKSEVKPCVCGLDWQKAVNSGGITIDYQP